MREECRPGVRTCDYPAMEENRNPSSCSLIEASQYGILQRCIELVEQENVSVVDGDEEGITVLHWAAINNRIPVARYVLKS